MSKKNVLLVERNHMWSRDDLEQLVLELKSRDSQLNPVIVNGGKREFLKFLNFSRHPTFLFCPGQYKGISLLRGHIACGKLLGKRREYEALDAHHIPTLPWAYLTQDQFPDLSTFPEFVIMKPEYGGRGADVLLVKKSRVHWRETKSDYLTKGQNWIVQPFIFTGKWPLTYRVCSLYGNVLFSYKIEADHKRDPFEINNTKDLAGRTVLSGSDGCTFSLCNDIEILEFAKKAHAAFPDIPLLGVDVIVDADTGEKFILEVNAVGLTWHFSSPLGQKMQRDSGFDLYKQFGGLSLAADVLAEKVSTQAC